MLELKNLNMFKKPRQAEQGVCEAQFMEGLKTQGSLSSTYLLFTCCG